MLHNNTTGDTEWRALSFRYPSSFFRCMYFHYACVHLNGYLCLHIGHFVVIRWTFVYGAWEPFFKQTRMRFHCRHAHVRVYSPNNRLRNGVLTWLVIELASYDSLFSRRRRLS